MLTCGDNCVDVEDGELFEEECDDSFPTEIENAFRCNSDCTLVTDLCGSFGVNTFHPANDPQFPAVRPQEECDLGAGLNVPGSGCNNCVVEAGFTCTDPAAGLNIEGEWSICTAIPPPNTCGDGDLSATEGCDDGNTVAGDGCSATCTVESGFTCTDTVGETSTCTALPPPNVCGDGDFALSDGECDDGAQGVADGCDDTVSYTHLTLPTTPYV